MIRLHLGTEFLKDYAAKSKDTMLACIVFELLNEIERILREISNRQDKIEELQEDLQEYKKKYPKFKTKRAKEEKEMAPF